MTAITERDINPGEGSGEQPNPLAILNSLQPPIPNPDDKRDPIEARIYALLGDVTLPRSLLPTIQLSSGEISSSSPEQISSETKRRFDKLISSAGMVKLRREAWELFTRYIGAPSLHQSTTESYFLRRSIDLWQQMKNYAKDYLILGSGYVRVDIEGENTDGILNEVRSLAGQLSRLGSGSINLINDETRNAGWDGNELNFQFDNQGKITRLTIDEFKSYKFDSPFMHFIKELPENIKQNLKTPECNEPRCYDCYKIEPLTIIGRNHEYGERQNGIILNVQDLSEDQVFNLVERYINAVKKYPRNAQTQ